MKIPNVGRYRFLVAIRRRGSTYAFFCHRPMTNSKYKILSKYSLCLNLNSMCRTGKKNEGPRADYVRHTTTMYTYSHVFRNILCLCLDTTNGKSDEICTKGIHKCWVGISRLAAKRGVLHLQILAFEQLRQNRNLRFENQSILNLNFILIIYNNFLI